MGAKRKSYTPKFRQEAARLVIETQRPIVAVARELGVGLSNDPRGFVKLFTVS